MANDRFEWLVTRHGMWIGPAIAIPGFVSYFLLFSQWAWTRDTALVNILLVGTSVGFSFSGLRYAWPNGGWRRIAAAASLLTTAGLTALLLYYVHGLSNQLPDAQLAAKQGDTLPAAVLMAHDGSPVDLHAAGQSSLILVFYRGFW